MPDDQKPPEKKPGLLKQSQDFTFGEAPDAPAVKVTPDKQPAPSQPFEPRRLTKEDMDFEPYKGIAGPEGSSNSRRSVPMDPDDYNDEDDDFFMGQEWEAQQERTFEAAGSMFRHNRVVTDIMSMLSNLEMQSVITAGILDEQYRGRLPDARVNDLMIGALSLNAQNFDDICGYMSPEACGMVDELVMMAEEPDEALRLNHARNLEPDSKRILLANTIADMEMTLHEMDEYGDKGPSKKEHDQVGSFIAAMSGDIDRGLMGRAIASFNKVGVATGNSTTLKQQPDGTVAVNPFPDLIIKAPKPEPAQKAKQDFAKQAPSSKKKKPGKKGQPQNKRKPPHT